MPTRARILAITLWLVPCLPTFGQALWLADGHRTELRLPGRIENGVLEVTTDGGARRIPVANILRLEWPLPAAFTVAANELKLGHAEQALELIGPWLDAQEPLRDLPGSSWNAGVSLRAAAFVQLGEVAVANAILATLQEGRPDPIGVARTQLAMAEQFLQARKIEEARAQLAAVGKGPNDDAIQARLAILQGAAWQAVGKLDEALLSYLRVPIYYSRETDQLPPALLGALRCYRALGDAPAATRTATRLQTDFPASPEAATARLETAPAPPPPPAP